MHVTPSYSPSSYNLRVVECRLAAVLLAMSLGMSREDALAKVGRGAGGCVGRAGQGGAERGGAAQGKAGQSRVGGWVGARLGGWMGFAGRHRATNIDCGDASFHVPTTPSSN